MDIKLPWGKTIAFELAVHDQDGQPFPLLGKTLLMMAKRNIKDLDAAAIFKLTVGDGITVSCANGDHTAAIRIVPANTAPLSRSATTTLHYELYLQEGDDRFPLEAGKAVVTPSVPE